jgi:hypothetical protein
MKVKPDDRRYEQVAVIFSTRELVDLICAIGCMMEKLKELPPHETQYEYDRLKTIFHKIEKQFKG